MLTFREAQTNQGDPVQYHRWSDYFFVLANYIILNLHLKELIARLDDCCRLINFGLALFLVVLNFNLDYFMPIFISHLFMFH